MESVSLPHEIANVLENVQGLLVMIHSPVVFFEFVIIISQPAEGCGLGLTIADLPSNGEGLLAKFNGASMLA